MAIKGLIFDLDGTLLDTLGDIHAAVNHALACLDIPCRSIGEVKSMIGDGVAKLIERALPKDALALKGDALKLFRDYYVGHMRDLSKPYEGIAEMISSLKGKYAMAVLSNKPDYAVKEIVPAYFGDAFSHAVGGREGIPLKPHPQAVATIIADWGIEPADIAIIGDGVQDIKTALAVGAMPIGVSWGFSDGQTLIDNGAEYLCYGVHELKKRLQVLNRQYLSIESDF